MSYTKTIKIRVCANKTNYRKLDSLVFSVNFIWNYLVDEHERELRSTGVWNDYRLPQVDKDGSPRRDKYYNIWSGPGKKAASLMPPSRSFKTSRGLDKNFFGFLGMSGYDIELLLRNQKEIDVKVTEALGLQGLSGVIGEIAAEYGTRLAKVTEMMTKRNTKKTTNTKKNNKKHFKINNIENWILRRKLVTQKDLDVSGAESYLTEDYQYIFQPNYNNIKGDSFSRKNEQSLKGGWIPFKAADYKIVDGKHIKIAHHEFSIMEDLNERILKYGVDFKVGAGSFNRDSQGRWWINISVTYTKKNKPVFDEFPVNTVGIDSGFHDTLNLSDGNKFSVPLDALKEIDRKIAAIQKSIGQKARLAKNETFYVSKKDKRIAKLQQKAVNIKKDFINKVAIRLVKDYDGVVFGSLNLKGIQRTHGKSVRYHAIAEIKAQLLLKGIEFQKFIEDINEAKTTITCSSCESPTGPYGRAGLGIREWTCKCCGVTHDRDTNAAQNILEKAVRKKQGENWPSPSNKNLVNLEDSM